MKAKDLSWRDQERLYLRVVGIFSENNHSLENSQ